MKTFLIFLSLILAIGCASKEKRHQNKIDKEEIQERSDKTFDELDELKEERKRKF